MEFIDTKAQQFYEDLNKRMEEAEQRAEAERAERKRKSRVRQMGNVLSGLANLYWASKGAPSQEPAHKDQSKTNGEIEPGADSDRLMKARQSLARLRMAGAKTAANIDYTAQRQQNETRKTEADIGKREAEVENLKARGSLIESRTRLTDAATDMKRSEGEIKRQEAENIGQKHEQEAEIRRARAQAAWAAAERQRTTLQNLRRQRGRK